MRARLLVNVMLVAALGTGCDSKLAPGPGDLLGPSPTPVGPPHQVVLENWLSLSLDTKHGDVLPDEQGVYVVHRDSGWYCVVLRDIPPTAGGQCREYSFAFSWSPTGRIPLDGWSDDVWASGCRRYPNDPRPYLCFQSPKGNDVAAMQSIVILANDRTADETATESLRTAIPIRFRDP